MGVCYCGDLGRPCNESKLDYVGVEEDSNWKEVEEWIEEWMREKRDNITVRLTVIYQKVARDDIESSDDENVPAKGSKVL